MSKIGYSGITESDKQGFLYTCYVSIATKNLKSMSMDMFTYYGHIKEWKYNFGFCMIFGLIVSL